MKKSLSGLVLLCGLLAACEGDDDTAVWDAGPDGSPDAPVADGGPDAPVADSGPDAARIDGGDGSVPGPRMIRWTVERVGGEAGCQGVSLIAVGLDDGDDAIKQPACSENMVELDLPAEAEHVVLKAMSPSFAVLGSARIHVEGTGNLTGKIVLTGEPYAQLQTLREGATAYFAMHDELPPSRVATPTVPCCMGTDGLCEAKAEDWTPFAGVGFAMTSAFRFQYGLRRIGTTLRISAIADYDCDSKQNIVFVDGRITEEGFLEWTEPAVQGNE